MREVIFLGDMVSVIRQLSSKGRTGILSMVVSWKFAQGPGGPVYFLCRWRSFGPSAGTEAYGDIVKKLVQSEEG
jgi:hypothetical protein